MVTHYGEYVQDYGIRPKAICGQWSGGFGEHSPVTKDKSKVNCKKCLKKLSKSG